MNNTSSAGISDEIDARVDTSSGNSTRASLDTNLLLRLILNDIPDQRAKAIGLINTPDAEYYICDLVVAEVVFVLQSLGCDRPFIADKLQKLFSLPQLHCNMTMLTSALPYWAAHPSLSFVDCAAAFTAGLEGADPLYTFDRKLANQHPDARLII